MKLTYDDFNKLQEQNDLLQASKDLAYSERNKMLVALAKMSKYFGFICGLGRHEGGEWDDDWRNIVFIDLPAGQVSFHIHDSELSNFDFLPPYPHKWDGHSTEEKWLRILRFHAFNEFEEEVEQV